MLSYSPLALHQVHDQLTLMWEQHCIQGAILRSNLDAIAEFPVTFEHVTSELDHYSPTLGELLTKQGFGPNAATTTTTSEEEEEKAATAVAPKTFAWKHVPPLLPLASRRRNIPLLTRDTGDSVDEKKTKIQARKRRRREIEEEEAAARGTVGGAPAAAAASAGDKAAARVQGAEGATAEEERAALQEVSSSFSSSDDRA